MTRTGWLSGRRFLLPQTIQIEMCQQRQTIGVCPAGPGSDLHSIPSAECGPKISGPSNNVVVWTFFPQPHSHLLAGGNVVLKL